MVVTIFKVVLVAVLFLVGVAVYYRVLLWMADLTVTSWFRTPSHNARVGGVKNSLHLLGWSFDVVPVNSATMGKLRAIGFRKILSESDHIHAQIV